MRKHFLKPTVWTALVATGLFCALSLTSLAQPAAGGGGGNFRGGGMLDDQQRQLYREALQKDNDKLRALDEQLRTAQKELLLATLAEKYDEKTVQDKAEAVAKIQVQIMVLNAKAMATVAPTLKAEQKENLISSRIGFFMLSGGMGGMGGGDFMRGGGPQQDRGATGDRGGRGRGQGGQPGQTGQPGQGRPDRPAR